MFYMIKWGGVRGRDLAQSDDGWWRATVRGVRVWRNGSTRGAKESTGKLWHCVGWSAILAANGRDAKKRAPASMPRGHALGWTDQRVSVRPRLGTPPRLPVAGPRRLVKGDASMSWSARSWSAWRAPARAVVLIPALALIAACALPTASTTGGNPNANPGTNAATPTTVPTATSTPGPTCASLLPSA